jgi:hypothetical protein
MICCRRWTPFERCGAGRVRKVGLAVTQTDGETADGELVLYVGLGQSLLDLVPRLRPLSAKPGDIDPGRALVFLPGGDTRFGVNTLNALPPAALDQVYPLRRGGRSGPLTFASQAIVQALGPRDVLLTVNLARKGARLAAFGASAETESFANLRRCVLRAEEIAHERGLRFGRMVVSWVQGQTDNRTPRGTYSAMLQALVADTAALHHSVTGVAGQVLWCISQNVATQSGERRCVALDQVDAVQALPGRMIMACPEYMLERSDGVHLTPMAAAYLGALHGRAVAQTLAGARWQPLEMVSACLAGDAVSVGFAGGAGRLIADAHDPAKGAVRVGARAVPNLGFHWTQRRGEPPGIVGHEIVGDRAVRLRLSHAPLPDVSARLTLGVPPDIGNPEGFVTGDPATARGACTNLRTEGDGSQILGFPLQDWAIHTSVQVTVADGA